MDWLQTIQTRHAARASHMFLLHLGIHDLLIDGGALKRLSNIILARSPMQDAGFTAFFNRAEGIMFADEETEERFKKFLGKLYPYTTPGSTVPLSVEKFERNRRAIPYMFELFSEMLFIRWDDPRERVRGAITTVFHTSECSKSPPVPFFVAVVEYAESLAPPTAMYQEQNDRTMLVGFLEWGKNENLIQSGNLIILSAEHLGMVAPQLATEANGIMPLEVPLPTFQDRTEALTLLARESTNSQSLFEPKEVARFSAGLPLRSLREIARVHMHEGTPITGDELFQKKKNHLEDRSAGMAELCNPLWGLDAIGALEDKKAYIQDVVSAMKRGNVLAVPQGILLLGGPGTGKTVFVEALAYEAGIPFVRLKNLRSMWVGQSERNQDYILKLLVNYAPLVVFIDELDQDFLMRGQVFHGDTGVSARMQKRFMEIMSDTNLRGQILWIGASNKPELIDEAIMREGRMDDVLPFLPPNKEERGQILFAILHKLARQAEHHDLSFSHEVPSDFAEKFGWLTHFHFHPKEGLLDCTPAKHTGRDDASSDEEGFTGAEIEHIVRTAYTSALRQGRQLQEEDIRRAINNFIPKRDVLQFRTATNMALLRCNNFAFIPREWRERAKDLRSQRQTQQTSSTRIQLTPGQYL